MILSRSSSTLLYPALAFGLLAAATLTARAQDTGVSITPSASRVSIAGTSNVHDFSASTTDVRVTHAQLAEGCNGWDDVLKPGGLEAFEIAIPAASLKSGDNGMDKNMHKALKAPQQAEIVFRVSQVELIAGTAYRASGTLRIAGVERPVSFELTAEQKDGKLVVAGSLPILMTDYGIAPPKAMLGMLRTDPKVTVNFATTLSL